MPSSPPVSRASATRRPSAPRRFLDDLMRRARRVPAIAVERRLQLGPAARARRQATPRIGWAAMFVRGYALMAVDRPILRRCFLSFPVERYYEHPESVATVVVEREWDGERVPFYRTIRHPEQRSLAAIEERLQRAKTGPAEATGSTRLMLRAARFPRPLRRLLWWIVCDVAGTLHARHIGTFALSSIAATGAELTWILSPAAVTLTYGPIDAEGFMTVRLFVDHRVFDGALAGEILGALEEVLNGPVAEELTREMAA